MRVSEQDASSGGARRPAIRRIAAATAVLAVVVAAGGLLAAALASRLHQWLVGEAARSGMSLRIDRVSVRLIPGRATLRGVSLVVAGAGGERDVFRAGSVVVCASPAVFLRADSLRLRRVSVADGLLTIERAGDGGLDLPLSPRAPAAGAGAVAQPPAAVSPAAKRPQRQRIRIADLGFHGIVRVVDAASADARPNALDFRASLDGRGLSWAGGQALDAGEINLSGHLLTNRAAFVTALRVMAMPSTNGWSFDADGTVSNADPRVVAPQLAASGLSCGAVNMTVALACRDERFNQERSRIALDLRKVELAAPGAAQPQRLFRELALDIPIGGTLSHPEPNVAYALLSALSQQDGGGGADLSRMLLEKAGKSAGSALNRLFKSSKRGSLSVTNAPAPDQTGSRLPNQGGTP